jgi:hypothetical protein
MAISLAWERGPRHVRSALVFASALLAAACGGQSFGGSSADAGGSMDAGGPDACQGTSCPADAGACTCTGSPPSSPNYPCTDGTTGGPYCDTTAPGVCSWATRTCISGCPGLGCAPACPNGVLKDMNGCDTCTCAPGKDGGSGSTCTSNSDCGTGFACGFKESAGCSATGTCVTFSPVACNAYSPGCGCDSSELNLVYNGLPSGYASAPVAHSGSCTMDGGLGGLDASTDGGACCPAGWSLYACTYSGGAAGMACHNPALGCASSTTCGQGCDEVVTGRCVP